MKRFLVVTLLALSVGSVSLLVMASRYEEKARPGSSFEGRDLTGLTRAEATKRIEEWWSSKKTSTIRLTYPGIRPITRSLSEVGVGLDVSATVNQVPFEGFWSNVGRLIGGKPEETNYKAVFSRGGASSWGDVEKAIKAVSPQRTPARVLYRNGGFERIPEKTGIVPDITKLQDLAYEAAVKRDTVKIPVVEAPKKVADSALESITEIVSEYRTTFNAGQASRTNNIALAASKLDGLVLAPGEKLSFNGSVGKRTAKAGFKVAGVYANGRHEVDLGGGICQVSSTLYNAALFANLKIVSRTNHSMPVPYLPIGRDATVDYGNVDLVIENSLNMPIAVNSEFQRGALTFRILGIKDESLKVEVVSEGASSWSLPIKKVPDPSLPAGKEKVIEKGSRGYAVNTYRVVYRDGVEVLREPLGKSHYRGGSRIVAVGTKQTEASIPETDPEPTQPEEGA